MYVSMEHSCQYCSGLNLGEKDELTQRLLLNELLDHPKKKIWQLVH